MMELSEDFIKFIQIGLTVVGILTIFLLFISYNVNLLHDKTEREVYVLGDYLTASKCLVAVDGNNAIKGLLEETDLTAIESDPSCINYPKGMVNISLINCGTHTKCNWNFELSTGSYVGTTANFTVAIEMDAENGSIEPAKMTVTL
jgi:hypothetical protein